jgi:hypothetical protein
MSPLSQLEHGFSETFNNLGTTVYNALLRLVMAPGVTAAAAATAAGALAATAAAPEATTGSEGGSNGSASAVFKSAEGAADSRG